jgi:adenosylhomocysteine nucleosidase
MTVGSGSSPAPVRLVVALAAEARPLTEHFRMSRCPCPPFPHFRGDSIELIVTGTGKISAAAGTAYLHSSRSGTGVSAWLNVGVAGHVDRPLGDATLAHRVTDQGTGRNWYPPLVFDSPCPSESLVTVDLAQSRYPEPVLYDMEGAGFVATAHRFASAELVHCCKIVSDNRSSPAGRLTADRVSELVHDSVPLIDALVAELGRLVRLLEGTESDPAELEGFLARWHFTVSERHRLRRLLRRWSVLTGGQAAWSPELAALQRGKDVLRGLERRLDALPVRFPLAAR